MADYSILALLQQHRFKQSAVGIAVTDPAGRFLRVNRTYCRVTGYSARELTSRDLVSITHPDDVEWNRRLAQRMLTGEICESVSEKRYLHKSGAVIWMRNSVSVVGSAAGTAAHAISVMEDITERKRGEESMEATRRRMRQMSSAMMRVQDAERRRMARELHDSTGQLLAGVILHLGRARNSQLAGAERDDLLAQALEWVGQCSREIRSLSFLLHPPLLDELGLVRTLQDYAGGFERRTGVETKFRAAQNFPKLPRETELTIFRIVQESLANILKHSGSRVAAIDLRHSPNEVRLEVRDYGRGMETGAGMRAGVGILGMQERVELLDGRFEISSNSRGTRISAVLPRAGLDEEANPDRG